MKADIKFSIPVSIFREDKQFVVYTPALDLSTSGKSYEEAKKRFGQAVLIFFDEIIKKGTLEEVLSELGWRKIRKRWSPPVPIAQNFEEFTVPLPV